MNDDVPPNGHDASCEYRRRNQNYGPCWCRWRWRISENRRIYKELIERYMRDHPEMIRFVRREAV